MDEKEIDTVMNGYVQNSEMAGGALLVRNKDKILYQKQWGAVQPNSIYRLMSMTKCITAVAVMICVERGLMELDAPLSRYIPAFEAMQVMDDARYAFRPEKLKKLPMIASILTFSMDRVKRTDAVRQITIRDLLSHSSGLQQGMAGLFAMLKEKEQFSTLQAEVQHYAHHVLDFQPGTGTGYSPIAGFDTLGYVVSVVSGQSLEDFVQKNICRPLGMQDTTFFLSEAQKKRLVPVYKRKKGQLVDVTDTKEDMQGTLRQNEILFEHGSGGLFSTLADYDRFGAMLLHGGTYNGAQILQPETVALLHTEAPLQHLEPQPGFVWGLGMKIRQDPTKSDCKATAGTYGWSGAFGTHFFISPQDGLETVFMTNRADLGGSGSYISTKVEELVFGIWGQSNDHRKNDHS